VTEPWAETLTQTQHTIITYALVIAGLALLASLIRAWATQGEVSPRYRSAVIARIGVSAVALVSYAMLIIAFRGGYDSTPAGWVPNASAIDTFVLRYADWSITVPMLTIELLAVCALVGASVRRTRLFAVVGAFLMIVTGFAGGVLATSTPQALVWGAVSCVFWIIVSALLVREVRRSSATLTAESATLLRFAATALLLGWFLYPLVYLVQLFTEGGEWTTTIHVAFSLGDIMVKVGFGGLVHRVAKLRTAEDVRAGDEIHNESIWISSVKQSDAGRPREVYLAEGASVHDRRVKPPEMSAVAAPLPFDPDDTV